MVVTRSNRGLVANASPLRSLGDLQQARIRARRGKKPARPAPSPSPTSSPSRSRSPPPSPPAPVPRPELQQQQTRESRSPSPPHGVFFSSQQENTSQVAAQLAEKDARIRELEAANRLLHAKVLRLEKQIPPPVAPPGAFELPSGEELLAHVIASRDDARLAAMGYGDGDHQAPRSSVDEAMALEVIPAAVAPVAPAAAGLRSVAGNGVSPGAPAGTTSSPPPPPSSRRAGFLSSMIARILPITFGSSVAFTAGASAPTPPPVLPGGEACEVATPTPATPTPPLRRARPRTKRTRRTFVRSIVEQARPEEEKRAEAWAEQAAYKLGDKRQRQRFEKKTVKVKEVTTIPASRPWQTGSFGLLPEFFDESDSDEEAPRWYVADQLLSEQRDRKKQKRSDNVPGGDDAPAFLASSATASFINSHGHSPQLNDLHPRRAHIPSPMFDGPPPTSHKDGSNIFEERIQDAEEKAREQRRTGHVLGSGCFTVPEGSSSDDDSIFTDGSTLTGGGDGMDTAGNAWTTQPPPAPTPAHAILPVSLESASAIPRLNDNDTANFADPRIASQRASALKHSPAKGSGLRAVSFPSPSIKSGNSTPSRVEEASVNTPGGFGASPSWNDSSMVTSTPAAFASGSDRPLAALDNSCPSWNSLNVDPVIMAKLNATLAKDMSSPEKAALASQIPAPQDPLADEFDSEELPEFPTWKPFNVDAAMMDKLNAVLGSDEFHATRAALASQIPAPQDPLFSDLESDELPDWDDDEEL